MRGAGRRPIAGATHRCGAVGRYQTGYETLVVRRPDSDFYHTFFNSVTRDLFGTVGVNREVEFCATSVGRASGSVPIRVYRVGGSLPTAVREMIADLPFGEAIGDTESAVHRISAEIGRYFQSGRNSGAPESIELIEPVFYRGMHAFAVGRLIGDSAITPLVHRIHEFSARCAGRCGDVVARRRWLAVWLCASYFHVDLPVVSAAITLLRSFMPRKPVDELYTVLGRAKQGKTERYFALQRHLDKSIDSFVHAPGERGLVMMVFTLPSHDLVFKVIRDRFGRRKPPPARKSSNAISRVSARSGRTPGRCPGIQAPAVAAVALHAGSRRGTAARRQRQLPGRRRRSHRRALLHRTPPAAAQFIPAEAEPAAAEAAIIDYGNALRDLAASNVFPGDLLLKNFGVTSHGRVIFYDYDEICLVSDCVYRDLPQARTEDEETSAEPWFYCGPRDVSLSNGCSFFPYRPRCARCSCVSMGAC